MPEASAMEYAFMALPNVKLLNAEHVSTSLLQDCDGVLVVFHDASTLSQIKSAKMLGSTISAVQDLVACDQSVSKAQDVHLLLNPLLPGGRMVVSSTGPLLRDYDDVRRYGEAAGRVVKRAKATGLIKRPILVLQPPPFAQMEETVRREFEQYYQVALLAALAELHEPLEAREALPELSRNSLIHLSLVTEEGEPRVLEDQLRVINAIETGRRLARDIGGCDPERMNSINAAATVQSFFTTHKLDPVVKVHVADDLQEFKEKYPLLAAVARASEHVPRHAPRIVHLEYRSPDQSQVQEELYMVGKGINYDTGGADVKAGGNMVGMSRDKCGAAAMAGFMAVCALLKPTHLNVTVDLAFVRNSIGSNAYVADEIIKSRAGVRVRIGNTDAEGRMVMADLLAQMKERALSLAVPQRARLFTCATLTGHVGLTYGPYAAAMDNGPAKLLKIGNRIKTEGQRIGDCFELSTLRREDYDFVAPSSNCEDVVQANRLPSSATPRGHQYPAAFLQIASGLIDHGMDAAPEKRLAYTHLDIAGAAEEGRGPWGRLTGTPIAALTFAFLKN